MFNDYPIAQRYAFKNAHPPLLSNNYLRVMHPKNKPSKNSVRKAQNKRNSIML